MVMEGVSVMTSDISTDNVYAVNGAIKYISTAKAIKEMGMGVCREHPADLATGLFGSLR